jgi:predicted AlkP superfamily phosphohydrolase/phosphomutase
MRGIFERGAFFELASSADVLDASAWPTFYTASEPGHHGMYHPMQWDAAGMRMRRHSTDWIYAEPFWYALARRGIGVISADVPMLLPADMPCGIEIRNWSTQENTGPLETSPSGLAREVVERFGSYPIGRDVPIAHSATQLDDLRRMLVRVVPSRTQLWLWLMHQHDWRFAITVYAECHRGGHNLWPAAPNDGPGEALLEVYEAIDRSVEEILAATDLERTTVILFSAHGMGPNTSQSHLLQRIVDRATATFWQSLGRPATDQQGSIFRLLRESIPPAVQLAITRAVPDGVRDWVADRAQRNGVDWLRTPALALVCGQTGLIRLNVAGREQRGSLAPDDALYARYVQWLTESLLDLRATDRDVPVVDQVVNVHDRFPGPRSSYLPDIAVRWTDVPQTMEVRSERLGTIRARFGTGRRGNHSAAAFAVVMGSEPQVAPFRGMKHTTDLARAVMRSFDD